MDEKPETKTTSANTDLTPADEDANKATKSTALATYRIKMRYRFTGWGEPVLKGEDDVMADE